MQSEHCASMRRIRRCGPASAANGMVRISSRRCRAGYWRSAPCGRRVGQMAIDLAPLEHVDVVLALEQFRSAGDRVSRPAARPCARRRHRRGGGRSRASLEKPFTSAATPSPAARHLQIVLSVSCERSISLTVVLQ